MATRHYISMFKHLNNSKLLRLQVVVLFLTTYIDWVLMPFIAKLEGLHLPVLMISLYMLLGAADGFIQPLFKHVKIYTIYMFVIILDLIQILTYTLIFTDIVIFTYAILSIFTFQAITFEISRIHTADFMKDEIELKEYLMLRSFVVSAAIILGAVTAMFLDYFDITLTKTLIILALLGVFTVIIEYLLYKKFRKVIQRAKTIIQRQKSLLNEKFTVEHNQENI